jgi:hypothetical protein
VIGKISTPKADYYATNKRLLRFTSESRYQALEYPTLSVNKAERLGAMAPIFRIVLVLVGLLSVGLGCLIFAGGEGFSVGGSAMYKFGVSLLFWVVGLGAVALGFFVRISYYQIQAPGIAEKDRKNWRFSDSFQWSKSAAKFVEVLKQKSANP